MWAVNVAVFKTYDAAVASALVALFILLALIGVKLLFALVASVSASMSTKTIVTLMCPVCAMCVLSALPSSYTICSSLYITEVSKASPNKQTLIKLIRIANALKDKRGASKHTTEYIKCFAADFPGHEKYLHEKG